MSSSVLNIDYLTGNLLPQKIFTEVHQQSQLSDWKDRAFNLSTQYTILDDETEKINILIQFSKKLMVRSVDLDSEIVDMVNENFWELL